MTTITRRQLLGGCGAAGLAALAGCSGVTPFVSRRTESSETVDPDGAETVTVDTAVGDVTIIREDRDDIDVDIVKQSSSIRTDLDDLHFEVDHDDRLELRSVWEGSEGWFTSRPAMNLDIAMADGLELDRIDTSVGTITLRDVAGSMRLGTSTGNVDVESVDGAVRAETSTGDIEIETVDGAVSAETSIGDVRLRDIGQLGDLSTSTGDVETEVPAIDGETVISTSTGSVTAAIDSALDADLVVETSTGDISTGDLELDDMGSGDDLLTGTLGEGGPTLRIETGTGNIRLEQL